LEYGATTEGLRVVRTAAPAGAASFSATYVGPAGWGFDPSGEEGVARIVNHLTTVAAGRFDRRAWARLLDRAGATLSRQASPESAEVTIWGPARDWEALSGLLAEAVLRPRFDPEDLERVRRQVVERQLREMSQPGSRADRELLRTIYPEGHPYRPTGLGDRRSVSRIARADLREFHARRYGSAGALLVFTGPMRLSAAERTAKRLFGTLPTDKATPLRFPRTRPGPRRVRTLDLPGRSQVEVRLGGPSITEDRPEYPGAYLANEVLGGRPLLARLFQRVREKNGLAYHASSHLETMRYGGYWSAQAGTGPDRWRRVVPMVEDELERLRKETVPPRELDRIRESAIGEIALALESTAEAHALALDAAYHDLPTDFWITWPERLRKVRPDEVRTSADAGLASSGSATVVVGPLG
jgi:zinc protease